jgi:hypothetical protein
MMGVSAPPEPQTLGMGAKVVGGDHLLPPFRLDERVMWETLPGVGWGDVTGSLSTGRVEKTGDVGRQGSVNG